MTLAACADIVQKGDPDRWLSLMAAPVAARARLLPLYAFNLEVARAPWVSHEPAIGQMRLQWWRDALAEIAEGGPVRRHEVVTPLAEVLPPEAAIDLDTLILMRHRDLETQPFHSREALVQYLEETGGGLLRAAAAVLGAGPHGLDDAGFAGATAAYLRAVAELTARGRHPLPDAAPEAIAGLASDALTRWNHRGPVRPDRAAAPALLALWRTPDLLRLAATRPEAVLAGGLDTSPARRHVSILWRRLVGVF